MTKSIDKKDAINTDVQKRFKSLANENRLAHAYLFIGPKGVGKLDTARSIVKMVICEDYLNNNVCDCPTCAKIDSGNHPDVRIIESEFGETIKIDEIRELTQLIQYRPFEATHKVFIIENIENITLEGANALLKTLEEPTKNSLIILTSSVPERVLPTVYSRCQPVVFYALNVGALASILHSEYDIKADQAQFIAHFAEGSRGKAEKYLDQGLLDYKNEVIDQFILYEYDDAFIKELLADKEETKLALDVLMSWFRDLWLLSLGIDDKHIINRDRLTELVNEVKRYSLEDLDTVISEIVTATQLLRDNLNVKIALIILREKIWVRN